MGEELRVLAVEDEIADARLLEIALTEAVSVDGLELSLDVQATLAAALQAARDERWDVALVDLRLPDADGLEAVERLLAVSDPPPVVVITGLGDQELALQALSAGAQDYAVKGRLDPRGLLRTIAYAVARGRSRPSLLTALAHAQHELELRMIDHSIKDAPESLIDTSVWPALCRALSDIIEEALDARAFAVERRSDGLAKQLAARLADLDAAPSDVMRLYTEVVREKVANSSPAKIEAYIEESRLILVALLGGIAERYRAERG